MNCNHYPLFSKCESEIRIPIINSNKNQVIIEPSNNRTNNREVKQSRRWNEIKESRWQSHIDW